MSSQSQSAVGRRRSNIRQYSVEDQALNMISKEAEARLAAKRAARAEAREIRMKEMEKQHKNTEEKSDKIYELTNEHATAKMRQQVGGSRRGSSESNDSGADGKDFDFKEQVRELEDKYKAAMMTSAQLDNEKQSLVYQVELLKDQLEEQDEGYTELQREYKDKCREYELQKRDMKNMEHELNILKQQLELKDRLIQESGFVIMSNDKGEPVLEKQSSSLSATANENLLPSGDILVSSETKEFLEKAGDGTLGTPINSNPSANQSVVSKPDCEVANDENQTIIIANPDNETKYVETSQVENENMGNFVDAEEDKILDPHNNIVMASKFGLHDSGVVSDLSEHAIVVDDYDGDSGNNVKLHSFEAGDSEPCPNFLIPPTASRNLNSTSGSDGDEFFDAVSTSSCDSDLDINEFRDGRINAENEGSSVDGNLAIFDFYTKSVCQEEGNDGTCIILDNATTSESKGDESCEIQEVVVIGSTVDEIDMESEDNQNIVDSPNPLEVDSNKETDALVTCSTGIESQIEVCVNEEKEMHDLNENAASFDESVLSQLHATGDMDNMCEPNIYGAEKCVQFENQSTDIVEESENSTEQFIVPDNDTVFLKLEDANKEYYSVEAKKNICRDKNMVLATAIVDEGEDSTCITLGNVTTSESNTDESVTENQNDVVIESSIENQNDLVIESSIENQNDVVIESSIENQNDVVIESSIDELKEESDYKQKNVVLSNAPVVDSHKNTDALVTCSAGIESQIEVYVKEEKEEHGLNENVSSFDDIASSQLHGNRDGVNNMSEPNIFGAEKCEQFENLSKDLVEEKSENNTEQFVVRDDDTIMFSKQGDVNKEHSSVEEKELTCKDGNVVVTSATVDVGDNVAVVSDTEESWSLKIEDEKCETVNNHSCDNEDELHAGSKLSLTELKDIEPVSNSCTSDNVGQEEVCFPLDKDESMEIACETLEKSPGTFAVEIGPDDDMTWSISENNNSLSIDETSFECKKDSDKEVKKEECGENDDQEDEQLCSKGVSESSDGNILTDNYDLDDIIEGLDLDCDSETDTEKVIKNAIEDAFGQDSQIIQTEGLLDICTLDNQGNATSGAASCSNDFEVNTEAIEVEDKVVLEVGHIGKSESHSSLEPEDLEGALDKKMKKKGKKKSKRFKLFKNVFN